MSIAALIRRMTEVGAPAEAIALAVEEIEAIQDALTARRSADRDRKRAQRERQKSADVTGQSEDSPETVTPIPPPNESILTPPRKGKTEPKGSSKSPVDREKLAAIGSCLQAAYPPPTGVSAEQWAGFRKQRKKPLNARSYALLTAKLLKLADAGWPPGEMIDLAIERGWETVFEPRNFTNDRTNALGRNQPADGLSPTARAAIAVFGR